MAAEAKALLDELMGRARNLDPSQQSDELSWTNQDVCKYFLCGFCPHELFTNTRADLGSCNKIHDESLRKEYQKSPRFERCGYEDDFIRYLQNLIADVEKRIRRGHQRLALNNQQGTLNGGAVNQNEDKIKLLTEKISNLVQQAEELGCEGKVEEAQGVMKLADQLKDERHELEMPAQEDMPMMKQMEVCEVCGAFLIVGDAPQRQDEHLVGKQHAGYAQVRAELERRKQKAREELEAREADEARLKQEREEREQERLREREERKQREREREKEREREREKAREKRRRSRSRSRDRRRSHSRDSRRRRSSSRDRNRKRSQQSRDRRRHSRSSSRSKRSSRRSSSRDRKSYHRSSHDQRSISHNRSRSKERKSRSNEKDKDNDTGRRKDDKDRTRSLSSKKEIESTTTSEENLVDRNNHDRPEMDHITSAEDKPAATGDAGSNNLKNDEDAGQKSDREHGPSCMDTVVDGHSIIEGDSKFDD